MGHIILREPGKADVIDYTGDAVDLIVDQVDRLKEYARYVFTVKLVAKFVARQLDNFVHGIDAEDPQRIFITPIEAIKLREAIEHWVENGMQISPDGSIILLSPRLGPDP